MSELKYSKEQIIDACKEAGLGILECNSLITVLGCCQPEATKPAQDLSAAILALPLPKPFDSGDGNHEDKFTESQFREFRAAAAALASPADALVAGDRVAVKDAVRNALELYADSYERMNRQNPDCKVSPTDVAYDIRRNMVESTIAAIQAQKDGHGQS